MRYCLSLECLSIMWPTIIICLLSVSHCCVSRGSESIAIVALPRSDSEGRASWENREEIIVGAHTATKRINNDSNILSDTKLTLVIADGGLVMSNFQPYAGNVLEMVSNLTWHGANIIGITGLLHSNTLIALQAFRIPIISFIHFSGKRIPNPPKVEYKTASSEVLIDSVIAFLAIINQTKIGVITETHHLYYSKISNELHSKVNVTLYLSVDHSHDRMMSTIVNMVSNSNTHVTFLSVSPSIAVNVLHEAYKNGLRWPHYAWILHSYRLDDLVRELQSSSYDLLGHKSKILDGVLVFQLVQEFEESKLNIVHNDNPFAVLLHDAVLDLASISSSTHTFQSLSEYANIYIYQSFNLTPCLVGMFRAESKTLTNVSVSTFIFKDLAIRRTEPGLYLISIPVLLFIFNTVLLVLFICFRNDPNVKSTNFSISLLMFIGCYILVGYIVVLILPPTIDVCIILVWPSALGLSVPLILTALLVKMVRVYRIFTVSVKLKSNFCIIYYAPFVYTLLILSPNVAILLLWTMVDPFRRVDKQTEHPGFIMIESGCSCKHQTLWITLLIIYFVMLSLAVVVVAVKSRKIRLAQFKDTKKVNLFIFLLLFVGFSTFSYWSMFVTISGNGIAPTYIMLAGHTSFALITQFTLIIPKIWPPFIKKVTKLLMSINKQCT